MEDSILLTRENLLHLRNHEVIYHVEISKSIHVPIEEERTKEMPISAQPKHSVFFGRIQLLAIVAVTDSPMKIHLFLLTYYT